MANGTTEKIVDPKDQRSSDNPSNAYDRFLKVREDKANAKVQDPSSADKTGQSADLEKKGDVKEKVASKSPWEGLRIVDKDNNPAKLPISVDGESFELDDINKIATSAQFGFHHDKRGKDLTEREDKLKVRIQELEESSSNIQKGMPYLEKIKAALESGAIQFSPEGTLISTGTGKKDVDPDHIPISKEDEDLEDSQYLDLAKRFNKMITYTKKQDQTINALKQLQISQLFKEKKTEIDTEIARLKPEYPQSDETEVINFLAELDANKRPKYNIKQAMEMSHKNIKKRFEGYIEKDPQFMDKTEAQKKDIIKEYLDSVDEKNKHPQGAPQGAGAAGSELGKKDKDPNKALTPDEHRAASKASFAGAADFLTKKLADANKA